VSAKRTMLDRGGGSKKSVFGRTSLMDEPLQQEKNLNLKT